MSSKKVERTHIYTPRTTLSRILEVTNEDLMESGRSPAHNKVHIGIQGNCYNTYNTYCHFRKSSIDQDALGRRAKAEKIDVATAPVQKYYILTLYYSHYH